MFKNHDDIFITIRFNCDFINHTQYHTNQKLTLKKDTNNIYDDEAIAVYNENNIKWGYVANSVSSVARGTNSAGYIYQLFGDEITCVVYFITYDCAIARLIKE